jgi:hypothetical protein
VIRAYEAAWESLDLAALRRVQALSRDEADRVAQTMASAREYVMQVVVLGVTTDADGRRASARCQMTREFHPRVGRQTRHSGTSTLRFEKRDGAWIIVSVE